MMNVRYVRDWLTIMLCLDYTRGKIVGNEGVYMMGSLYYYRILILAAIVPAIYLLVKVYQADRVEKESPRMLVTLVICGIFSTVGALILEVAGDWILRIFVPEGSVLYHAITCFIIVAYAEEGCKYIFLKLRTWKSAEFNCLFDGMLYAVYISLGFAVWENLSYSFSYGLGTALVRAVTAIPGHACFGVFMGMLYGFAKQYERMQQTALSKRCRVLAVVVAALIHGCYDFILSVKVPFLGFVAFVIVMFVIAFRMVRKMSDMDRYI